MECNRGIKFIFTLFLCFLGNTLVKAQDDSLALPYPQMLFNDPGNFSKNIEYSLVNRDFSFQNSIGGLQASRPTFMSESAYKNWLFKQQIKSFWKDKVQSNLSDQGIAGTKPKMKIGGESFSRVFGGNTVDIRPQGSAELSFSGNVNKTKNPSLTENQRNQSNFNFDQSIQMNVIGKIGTKLSLRTNYDTKSQFDFENQMKLEYTGTEDEIIKKIELGNVSLPLSGSLISGTQSLFGVKAQFQFGKATFTTVFSEQKSETSTIRVEGGAQTTNFEIYADDYEANRHFFLSQYFYNSYDVALANMPLVSSNVTITNLEVWVTNKTGNTSNVRNILAFQDLGENLNQAYNQNLGLSSEPINITNPDNRNNNLFPTDLVASNSSIREVSQITSLLNGSGFVQSVDYEKIENAKKLSSSEYTYNAQLGFISLNQSLNSDEVLGVSFQYTVNGTPYQVGEFSNVVASPGVLILKLLRSTTLDVSLPMWRLMMKNVYALGAYQVNEEDFDLQIMYQDDESGTPLPYIPEEGLSSSLIIQMLNLDNLNQNNDPGPNGVFDFISDLTIKKSNGRVYLPSIEPFGSYLRNKFQQAGISQEITDSYIFDALYDSTKTAASQLAELNKFLLKGQYKSSSGADIPLNAMYIPQGSVSVTMGGAALEENIHYTVDYNLGRVKIIDEGILSSGQQIDVKLENNSGYSSTTKRYLGLHADYKFNEDFLLSATLLNLSENSQTVKVNMGDEPISNTIWGINGSYKTESQLLTTLLDKLPLIETKEKSNITLTGEFAQFIPGHSKALSVDEEGTAYIDDFENSQSPIDLRNSTAWNLASTPQDPALFPEGLLSNDIRYGYNRALLSWYFINSDFQRETAYAPSHLTDEDREDPYVREISINEIFPDKDIPNGQPLRLRTFDLAFYPEERGPYNYDVEGGDYSNGIGEDGNLLAPETRWGGVVRKIDNNDFETANIEFLEFWLMDPFIENPSDPGGDFYINLGNVSEDILKDSRKSYENGLPIDGGDDNIDTTAWGRVPSVQALVTAFNSGASARENQDVGLDGLDDEMERSFVPFNSFETSSYLERIRESYGEGSAAYINAEEDPSADNYHFFYGSDYDSQKKSILDRYKKYNGLDGNSPMDDAAQSSYTQLPNVEDINSDYTLSESESYYQYRISMDPDSLQEVGRNFITSIIENAGPNNNTRWIQFKVPIRDFENKIGTIPDFKSIRFMRMFMRGFASPTVLRFATLDMVRGEWRKYLNSLASPDVPESDNTAFDISVVNLEENSRRDPVNYVLPPGIIRDRVLGSTATQQLNEQSMSFRVCDLQNGDARGAFKNVTMDMRSYKKIKFFVHAEEKTPENTLNDKDLSMFIRVGTDYSYNYYEYEVPLDVTQWGASARDEIWPKNNEFEISFDKLKEAKAARNSEIRSGNVNVSFTEPFSYLDGTRRITIVGNPNLGNVRTIMLGVRNPLVDPAFNPEDDGLDKCAEIWINELRLTDFDERGGWAAKAQMKTRLADIGSFSLGGNISSVGFGSLEQSVNERNKEETRQYNFTSNIELGKLFSEDANIKIPLYIGISETVLKPQFNPLDPDVELQASIDAEQTQGAKDTLRSIVENYTLRRSINLTNVRKERGGGKKQAVKSKDNSKGRKGKSKGGSKNKLYDIENISLSYSYNEVFNRNINTEFSLLQEYNGGIGYNFNNSPKNYKPFSKIKFLKKSKYLRLIKDFNFYLMPKTLSARTDFNKSYSETKMRNLASLNALNSIALIEPDTMFNKLFNITQNYSVKFDLTRSIKLNFSTNSRSIVDEPEGKIDTQSERDALRDSIMSFGRTTSYHHQFDVRYTVPINKFPLTDWVTLSLNYDATYDWNAGSRATVNDSINLGNVIQNTNNYKINTQLNLISLYNKVPYFKKVNSSKKKKNSRNKRNDKFIGGSAETNKSDKEEEEEEEEEEREFRGFEYLTKAILSVQNINFSYDEGNGTMLPGFKPGVGPLGLSDVLNSKFAPGWGFVLGQQLDADGLVLFSEKDWITNDTLLNQQYTTQNTQRLNIRATLEPVKKLRIKLTAQRNATTNTSQTFRNTGTIDDIRFESLNRNETGSFTMSFLAINTAFRKMEINSSKTFDDFRAIRAQIAKRVAADKGQLNYDDIGYPIGFGPNSQEVLLPAFMAAYSGTNASKQNLDKFPKTPLPNWTVKYDGLTDVKWIKKYFKNVSISHAYTSNYSIGTYNTNLFYDKLNPPTGTPESNPESFDANNNFIAEYQIETVNIREQFSPLIKLDLTMNNSLTTRMEYSREREISLSLNNNQVQEQASQSFTVGMGYRIDDFEISLNTANGARTFKSNLDLNLDFSIRKSQSAIRSLEENTHQGVSGRTDISIKSTVDYALSDKVNIQLFYDRMVAKYEVATSFDTANNSFGLKLRFTFGG